MPSSTRHLPCILQFHSRFPRLHHLPRLHRFHQFTQCGFLTYFLVFLSLLLCLDKKLRQLDNQWRVTSMTIPSHTVFFVGKIHQDWRWWKYGGADLEMRGCLSNCHDLLLLDNNYFFPLQVTGFYKGQYSNITQNYKWCTWKLGELVIDWVINFFDGYAMQFPRVKHEQRPKTDLNLEPVWIARFILDLNDSVRIVVKTDMVLLLFETNMFRYPKTLLSVTRHFNESESSSDFSITIKI